MDQQRVCHLKQMEFTFPIPLPINTAMLHSRYKGNDLIWFYIGRKFKNSPYSPQQLHRVDRRGLWVQEEEHSHCPLEYSRVDHQCTSELLPSKWEDEWDKSDTDGDYRLIGRLPYLRDTLRDVITEFALAIVLRRRDEMVMGRVRKGRAIERRPWTLTRITSGWCWREMVRMMKRSKINKDQHTSSPGRTHQ